MSSEMICPIKRKSSWNTIKQTFCNKIDVKNIISPIMLENYIKTGWADITETYKEGKEKKHIISNKPISPGKERKVIWKKGYAGLLELEQTLALEMLGSIRKYLVERMFRCASGKFKSCDHEYVAFGSTNVTSDYDLSILGPKANDIMWDMFKQFLNHYGNSLPYALDSNMYCGPIYSYVSPNGNKFKINRGINKIRLDYDERKFTFIAHTQEDLNEELYLACIKLIPLKKFISPSSILITKYISKSEKYKKYFDAKRDSNISKELQNTLKGHKDKVCSSLIRNYYLQYLSGNVVSKYIYENENSNFDDIIDDEKKNNIFFYSGQESYYSSEAYYTSAAVNAVVIEMQYWKDKKSIKWNHKNRKPKIKIYSYLTAALENIGDLYNHSKHEKGDIKKIIIKYSKYLYRIYNILGKINMKNYAEKAKKIKENVIPLRATYDMKEANKYWNLLNYNVKDSKEKYMEKICTELLKNINQKIQEYEYGKKKKLTIKKKKKFKNKKTRRKRN